MSSRRPQVHLRPGSGRALARGRPWIYTKELRWDEATSALPAGCLVDVVDARGRGVASASFHPTAPISLRCWGAAGLQVDSALLSTRLEAALQLRRRLYQQEFYRLVHAEGDGMPGVVMDRYGPVLALRLQTAGAEHLLEPLLAAVHLVLAPRSLLLHRQGQARRLEQAEAPLEQRGEPLQGPLEISENQARYLVDLRRGQKTGWYYDQQPQRSFLRRLTAGCRVLDAFCYSGGFAIQALLGGASEVLALDRSAPALELARAAAGLNGCEARLKTLRADAFEALPAMAASGERFDLLVLDPPPLARLRRHRAGALQAHRRLAEDAGRLLEPGGILLQSSCSHAIDEVMLLRAISQGLATAGRQGRVILRGGAGPDHPSHSQLPQTAYLTALALALD